MTNFPSPAARFGGLYVAAVCLCLISVPAAADSYEFYETTSAELAGAPGSIIRAESFRGSPWGTRAERILYRSTGLDGQSIAVSAVVIIPTSSPPAGGWKVVAWAHPTTGVARKCAPSLQLDGMMDTIAGLDEMVKRGYVIVATDYPGLGTAGVHPYLVGISEGRAVLDSVRAARTFAKTSNEYAVWGHSQGGHAAVWAAELAASYAPELKLMALAAAAPATELAELFDDDITTQAGQVLTALSLWSWSHVFDTSLDSVVHSTAVKAVGEIGSQCLSGFVDLIVDASAFGQIEKSFLKGDPAKIAPWSGYLTSSTPARQTVKWPPVFIAQGSDDKIVDPPVTTQFAVDLCNQGATLRYFSVPDGIHDTIAMVSAATAVDWIADRFDGKAAPTDCIVNPHGGGPR